MKRSLFRCTITNRRLRGNATDQSGLTRNTSEAPENVVTMFPLGIQNFTIPAGDESYTISDDFELPIGINIWVFPHMHVLGTAYEMKTENECLVASDRYDFDNQFDLHVRSTDFQHQTKFSLSCTWDNSTNNPNLIIDPPVVGYGEQPTKRCYVFTLASIAR